MGQNHTFIGACGDGTMRLYDRRMGGKSAVVLEMNGHSCWVQNVRWQSEGRNEIMSAR